MAHELVIRNGLKLAFTPPSGTGDNLLTYDSTSVGAIPAIDSSNFITTTLASGKIIVGNGSNVATAQTVTGDISISNGGVGAIASGVIVNADINASAAIDATKIANGSVSSTEFQYLDGVTSAIQTQLNLKAALAGPTFTGTTTVANIIDSGLTVNTVPYANGSKQLTSSAVTPTELGYVAGVTSAIQTQFGTKLSTTITSPADGDIIYRNSGTWINLARGSVGQVLTATGGSITWSAGTSNGQPVGGTAGQYLNKIDGTNYNSQWSTLTLSKVTDVTATYTEVNALSGVTTTAAQFNYLNTASSDIQTQINTKLNNSLSSNNIWVGNVSNVPAALATGANGYVLTSSSGVPTWAASASVALVDGNGTTANGAAVDLGGTLTGDADINGPHSVTITADEVALINSLITCIVDVNNTSIDLTGPITSVNAISYGSAGLVTSDRKLTDRGYVLGAKTYTGIQTFPSSDLVIQNPGATFGYTFVGDAIAANRNITLPLLAGNDTLVTAAFAQSLTNKKLGSLTTNGFVKTTGGDGTLSVDTSSVSVQVATVSISSAEMLNMFTSPKTLIAAQGANTYIHVLSVEVRMVYNSIAYATNTSMYISYNASGAALHNTSYLINDTNTTIARLSLDAAPKFNDGVRVNTPLVAYIATGNPTAGNSTFKVYVSYCVVTV